MVQLLADGHLLNGNLWIYILMMMKTRKKKGKKDLLSQTLH